MGKEKSIEVVLEKIDMGEKVADLFREDQYSRWRDQAKTTKELFDKFNKIKSEISDLKVEILERLHKLEKRVAVIAVTVSFIMSMLGPFLYKLIEKYI